MLLIYSDINSPRFKYICDFIFDSLLSSEFLITHDREEFEQAAFPKINYSLSRIGEGAFYLNRYELLNEDNIHPQDTTCFLLNGYKAFFKTTDSDYPFDIFAASFYLISRYEEYLPHEKDIYGRYAHENSLAFREGFLHQPLINIWVNNFSRVLTEKVPGMVFRSKKAPSLLITYDIDIAYSFLHKGFKRNVGGFLKSPSINRIKVLTGQKKDPFDSFERLDELHQRKELSPLYFFLVAEKNGIYDKNILPKNEALQALIRQHAARYKIGIHPSWQSHESKSVLKKEITTLEHIIEKEQPGKIRSSRQHYIKFELPEDYRQLIAVGISDDYSMGYGSINGFRASVATTFDWFDIKMDAVRSLRVHPFCYMEANSYYEQKYTAGEALEEMLAYYEVCRTNNATMITIWHNHFLGDDPLYKGWKEVYANFLDRVT